MRVLALYIISTIREPILVLTVLFGGVHLMVGHQTPGDISMMLIPDGRSILNREMFLTECNLYHATMDTPIIIFVDRSTVPIEEEDTCPDKQGIEPILATLATTIREEINHKRR